MSSIIFFSPHDLPYSHISRNFDYGKRLVLKGHRVTIIANNFSHRDKSRIIPGENKYFEQSVVEGVNVVWLNTIVYNNNGIKRALNAVSYLILSIYYVLTNSKNIDYCIGDSVPTTAGLAAFFSSIFLKSKFIFQVRDVWPIALVFDKAIKKISLTFTLLRIIEIILYKKSFKIIATVPFLEQHLIESGVNPRKLIYIPNGVDLNIVKYNPQKEKSSDLIKVTYAGGFGNAHDASSIICAANLLNKRGLNIRFDFYGEGVKLQYCIDLVKKYSLDNVYFHKSIDKSLLSNELNDSDILIAAVTDSDAYKFGLNLNKLYDYLAAGRPIILAVRSRHRVVEDAGCGYVVSPEAPVQIAEAIQKICDLTPECRVLMGAKGRMYAESNYDIDKLSIFFERALIS